MRRPTILATMAVLIAAAAVTYGEQRIERFDADPRWEAHNNRSTAFEPREITQQFGYSPTQHAGGSRVGEMGGLITPAAEPAYYAKVIPTATLNDKLTAAGTLACPGEMPFHALIGFFNTETLGGWRHANTMAIRINGRGEMFFAYLEYATSRWRAGGDSPGGFATIVDSATGRSALRGFKSQGAVHRWTLTYDPTGNEGNGCIVVTIDDERAVCNISSEHRLDGATFNRFGVLPVMKQWDSPGEIWLDDVDVNGELEEFSTDPRWDAQNNRRTYTSANVRPRFDFGYSPTNFAGGIADGELGGLIFRGDIREPHRMAWYGDRIETLSLDRPLRASGKIALRRGVSDSGTLLGFFNSKDSVTTNSSQSSALPRSFLGIAIEGPSSEGFFMYPAFRNARESNGRTTSGPHILPDGITHTWSLAYVPSEHDRPALLTVSLDEDASQLQLTADDLDPATQFDRFGIVTAWIDGNGQHIYFDDLNYTIRQE